MTVNKASDWLIHNLGTVIRRKQVDRMGTNINLYVRIMGLILYEPASVQTFLKSAPLNPSESFTTAS